LTLNLIGSIVDHTYTLLTLYLKEFLK